VAPLKRILLTRMRFIGDIVLTTAAIRSVRTACPDAYLAYMGDERAVTLLEHNPCLDEIIPYSYRRPSVFEQLRVGMALRRRNFDLVIDLFGNPRSALLTRMSGASVRVGPERRGRGRFYTVPVRDDGSPKTSIEFHNQYLRAAGIEPTADRTEIYLTDDERREARIYLQWLDHEEHPLDLAKPLVGMHAGATWPAKRWLPERFGQLAELVRARLGAQVVLTGGPDDGETIRAVRKNTLAGVTVIPPLPLRQLAAVMSHFNAFVTNDCGPMHISAALGVPTIGLFGPGEEQIWFPYSEQDGHRALRKNVPCHPCHLDVCNRPGDAHMECMKLLSTDEVFRTLSESL